VVHALLYDQYDYMKRIRAGGGAPDDLGHEDIAILIGTYTKDRIIAAQFGIPILGRDEIVGVRPRSQAEWQTLKDSGEIFTDRWTS
jgi:hypothetical protein